MHLGPPGGPAALKTRLGWTLQGHAKVLMHQSSTPQCLLINTLSPSAELLSHVTKLWQMDILPYRNEKLIIRSKQDTAAITTLEDKTTRVELDGVQRYATPLLWKDNVPPLQSRKEAVLGHLRGIEKRLSQDPARADTYNQEIKKLLDAGYISKITSAEAQSAANSWYIPHHMVQHNGKDRIVFNCSFTYQGASLNEHLLPGPTLGSTLLGVLLRFREYPVAVSSDIKGMFHQVRLLPEDKPFLRFLWRNMDRSISPDVYEWQVHHLARHAVHAVPHLHYKDMCWITVALAKTPAILLKTASMWTIFFRVSPQCKKPSNLSQSYTHFSSLVGLNYVSGLPMLLTSSVTYHQDQHHRVVNCGCH